MLEPPADLRALTGGVLQEKAQRVQSQIAHRSPNGARAGANPFLDGTASRAPRMEDEIVSAQLHGAPNLLPKCDNRTLPHLGIGCGEIEEIGSMNDDRIYSRALAFATKGANLRRLKRSRSPPPRIAREELHGLASQRARLPQGVSQFADDRSMNAKTHASGHASLLSRALHLSLQRPILGAGRSRESRGHAQPGKNVAHEEHVANREEGGPKDIHHRRFSAHWVEAALSPNAMRRQSDHLRAALRR